MSSSLHHTTLTVVVPDAHFPEPPPDFVPSHVRAARLPQAQSTSLLSPLAPSHAPRTGAAPSGAHPRISSAVVTPHLLRAAVDNYPPWVRQLVLPHQGSDVPMLPQPEARYELFGRPAPRKTIFGHVCFGATRALPMASASVPTSMAAVSNAPTPVAIKISNWRDWQKLRINSTECMLREVKHWYALSSPAATAAGHPGARHIIELIEVAYTDYEHWMVMPKAIGNLRDARAKLLEGVDESVHEALIYPRFVHLIDALDYMHSRGFVHLDVRCVTTLVGPSDVRVSQTCLTFFPFIFCAAFSRAFFALACPATSMENCLLVEDANYNEDDDEDGVGPVLLQVCDFGQTREMPSGSVACAHEVKFPISAPRGLKPYCAPPEFAFEADGARRFSEFLGSAVDVYACGVILYFLLVGREAFFEGARGRVYANLFATPDEIDEFVRGGHSIFDYYCRVEDGLRRLATWHWEESSTESPTSDVERLPLPPLLAASSSSSSSFPVVAATPVAVAATAAAELHRSPISQGAAEVLARMLCWPAQRFTISQLKSLPWLSGSVPD